MESKIRKTLVNVYSLVLSIFVCFIVGVALSKISDKVDMQALENLMLSGAFKQCRPERAETLQYMILTVLFSSLNSGLSAFQTPSFRMQPIIFLFLSTSINMWQV